jgi:hypothetical protein
MAFIVPFSSRKVRQEVFILGANEKRRESTHCPNPIPTPTTLSNLKPPGTPPLIYTHW